MRRGPRDLTDLTGPAVLHPLAYPGRPVTRPALLTDRALQELTVEGTAPGGWQLRADVLGERELEGALARLGRPPMERRRPVIAVGANGSPGRLRRKLAALDGRWAVPMVPVRVSGIAAGCSGHISRGGYVAVAPYAESTAEATFVVAWLAEDELRAVDATEVPHYRRVLVSGDRFRMRLPSGERLAAAHLYAGMHGLLRDAAGEPMHGGGPQADLLARLLAGSQRLRDLLGPDPRTWVARAGSDPEVRARGTRLLRAEGLVLARDDFADCR